MKTVVSILFLIFVFSSVSFADEATLSTPETLSPSSGYVMRDWEITKINNTEKVLILKYRWADNSGNIIYFGNNPGGYQWFVCNNGDPVDATCFSDIFGFEMRTQDVGTKIGVGFRNLIVNKLKQRGIISSGTTVTFDQD